MAISGLIHRARLQQVTRGARNAQGEFPETAAAPGPWFKARVMERGGVAAKQRRRDDAPDARVDRGYEVLADVVDENGAPVNLAASSVLITDCPVLGNPVIVLNGLPEKANNGTQAIVWIAYGDVVGDAA